MKPTVVASWSVIVTVMAFLMLIIYWLVYPYNPADFKTPHKLDTKIVKGGDFITLLVEYDRRTNDTPIVSRSFVDGLIYQIPDYVSREKGLGKTELHVRIYIPKTLPPGEYQIYSNYRYQVNPIRVIEKEVVSEKFIVIQ